MKIFIDGSAGTTGLRIKDRLMKRSDVELTTLSEEQRKDTESRKQAEQRTGRFSLPAGRRRS